jgi:hypothetical protein
MRKFSSSFTSCNLLSVRPCLCLQIISAVLSIVSGQFFFTLQRILVAGRFEDQAASQRGKGLVSERESHVIRTKYLEDKDHVFDEPLLSEQSCQIVRENEVCSESLHILPTLDNIFSPQKQDDMAAYKIFPPKNQDDLMEKTSDNVIDPVELNWFRRNLIKMMEEVDEYIL